MPCLEKIGRLGGIPIKMIDLTLLYKGQTFLIQRLPRLYTAVYGFVRRKTHREGIQWGYSSTGERVLCKNKVGCSNHLSSIFGLVV